MTQPRKNFVDLETLISTTFDQNLENASIRPCLETIFHDLESGKITLCEKIKGEWVVHEWIKKALLLAFRHFPFKRISAYPSWDRIPLRFESTPFDQGRQIPGSIVRRSAYLGPNVVLMPSFINVGAHIGQGTMIDTWSTIGSCAYIGKHCHISGGVGIGGVLEPLQEKPVIIEDNCFIGARSEIAEGVIVQEGSVISMGVFIGASTKIVDRETGKIIQGYIPPYSVVVPGTLPSHHGISLSCAVIVKQVDAKTRSKTSINELLRMV